MRGGAVGLVFGRVPLAGPEEYTFSDNMRAGDAIMAATAVESSLILSSSNAKHFRCVKELELKVFRP